MLPKHFVLMVAAVALIALPKQSRTTADTNSLATLNGIIKSTVATSVMARSNAQLSKFIEPSPNTIYQYLFRVWDWIRSGGGGDSKQLSESISESRTFGQIRRLKNALIPIMFKFGVISTLIFVLVFLALKTIFLLKALLVLNAGAILAKLIALKSSSGGHDHHHYVSPPVWQPPAWHNFAAAPQYGHHNSIGHSPWASTIGQGKEIHVHIHNSAGEPKSSSYAGVVSSSGGWNNEPYGGYSEQKQFVVAAPQNPQQNLVQIHRDDNVNYIRSRRYSRDFKL